MSIEEIKEWWNKLPSYDKLTFEESVVLTDTVDFLLAEIDRLTTESAELNAGLAEFSVMQQAVAESRVEVDRLTALLEMKKRAGDNGWSRAATHLADQDLLVARERKRVAGECAEIAELDADFWQKEMMIYPDGDPKVEVYEKAMVACEQVARVIRAKYGVERP